MKKLIMRACPSSVKRTYQRGIRLIDARRNAVRSPQQVFTEIYRHRRWGCNDQVTYFSGAGSWTPSIVDPYVAAVAPLVRGAQVVDLGCGDFAVSRRLLRHCASYVGVDVVPDLIRHLRISAPVRARFECLDIVAD